METVPRDITLHVFSANGANDALAGLRLDRWPLKEDVKNPIRLFVAGGFAIGKRGGGRIRRSWGSIDRRTWVIKHGLKDGFVMSTLFSGLISRTLENPRRALRETLRL
jgi:hypothetical protein